MAAAREAAKGASTDEGRTLLGAQGHRESKRQRGVTAPRRPVCREPEDHDSTAHPNPTCTQDPFTALRFMVQVTTSQRRKISRPGLRRDVDLPCCPERRGGRSRKREASQSADADHGRRTGACAETSLLLLMVIFRAYAP